MAEFNPMSTNPQCKGCDHDGFWVSFGSKHIDGTSSSGPLVHEGSGHNLKPFCSTCSRGVPDRFTPVNDYFHGEKKAEHFDSLEDAQKFASLTGEASE